MSKSQAPPGGDAAPTWMRIGLWQAFQLVFAALFLGMLHGREGALLAVLTDARAAASILQTDHWMRAFAGGWLPGTYWRLAWPFWCLCFAFLFFSRRRWYVIALLGGLSSLALVADRIYHDFFASVIAISGFQAIDQVWAMRASVLASLRPADFFNLAAFLLFAGFGWVLNRRMSLDLTLNPRFFALDKLWAVLYFVAGLLALRTAFALPNRYLDRQASVPAVTAADGATAIEDFVPIFLSSNKELATHFGVFNFHLRDAFDSLTYRFRPREPDPQAMTLVSLVLKERKALNTLTSPFEGCARGRNLVVISMEAFQHFLLDARVTGVPLTPVLNTAARAGLRWDCILDNAGLGGTSDAEFSVLTGLLPDTRQIASLNHPSHNRLLGLPLELKRAGYHTASFHGNEASFWNRDVNHPRLGFQQLRFEKSFTGKKAGLGIPDVAFFEQSGEALAHLPEPFFAFLISLTSHHPYGFLPVGEVPLDLSLPAGSMAARYLQSCAYADRALGLFFEKMKENGLWQRTVFMIYGDHIAPLSQGDRERLRTVLGIDPGAMREQRVPLVVLIPGQEERIAAHGESYRGVVGGLQDLFATVLHLLGMEIPLGVYGTHLFVPNQGREVVPFSKGGSNFVYKGILYSSATREPYRDEQGMLWQEGPVLQGADFDRVHGKAGLEVLAHRIMFDQDAQKKAIDAIRTGAPLEPRP